MSDYGRERWCEWILKIFGFLKSAAQAAQKCPRTLSSISSKILNITVGFWLGLQKKNNVFTFYRPGVVISY